jgi:hypothetical protein
LDRFAQVPLTSRNVRAEPTRSASGFQARPPNRERLNSAVMSSWIAAALLTGTSCVAAPSTYLERMT